MSNRRSSISIFILMLIALSISVPAPSVVKAKSYYAERYDVILNVQPQGDLLVQETFRFHFEGGLFTYVFRRLDLQRLDRIEELEATLDGKPLPLGTQPGQVEIERGQSILITWHLTPTSDATHEFGLSYRVQGAIRKENNADSLYWEVIPKERDYSIAQSQIVLIIPESLTPLENPKLEGSTNFKQENQAQRFVFHTTGIKENQPINLLVRFPAGSLISKAPHWQVAELERQALAAQARWYGGIAAALSGLLALVFILTRWRNLRERVAAAAQVLQNAARPPRALAPGLAAHLCGFPYSPLATLFDLAQRGILMIQEGERKWGQRTFEVVRAPHAEPLQPHEEAFLDALFRQPKQQSVPLSKVAQLAYSKTYQRALDDELLLLGWRSIERVDQRRQFAYLSATLMAVGAVGLAVGIWIGWVHSLGAILIGSGSGLLLVGLVGLILTSSISTLTDEGVHQASQWMSFAAYLKEITQDKVPFINSEIFDRYLPFAAGFGIATQWANNFAKQKGIEAPQWFHSLGSFTSYSGDDFLAVVQAISAADTSFATTASGADGGASGGGASGAG